jgi:transcription initiation factor TFIIB
MTDQRRLREPGSDSPAQQRESRGRASCPECDGQLASDGTTEEVVCEDCGLVVEKRAIDRGPEWRAFDAAERAERSRVGAPTTPLIHDRGLSTRIGWRDEDASGRSIDGEKRKRLARLRTWDERFRTRNAEQRNLKHALGEINRMASALGLPDPIRETASVTYRRALEEELLPGRSIEGVATAALYAATRLEGAARSIDEVATVSRVGKLEIERTYRYLARELELTIPPTNPAEYIGRFASDVGCSDETERVARELVDAAVEQGVHSGKNPVGIASSALYAAGRLTNEELRQGDVSEVANVSTVTVRNRYREILEAAKGEQRP